MIDLTDSDITEPVFPQMLEDVKPVERPKIVLLFNSLMVEVEELVE